MGFQGKRELLAHNAPRYREADGHQKTIILDEFISATGYARKYAIRLLNHPAPAAVVVIKRPRARRYSQDAQDGLAIAWAALNYICAKRLVPFLPELVPVLERHGHLAVSEAVRAELLTMSPATADRILRPKRLGDQPRGVSTTKRGLLLKHQIPVRTFSDWEDSRPGFLEGDLVAHCGTNVSGSFLCTLVLTDVATGWTEFLALLHRSQLGVMQGLERTRQVLPFPILGIDTDNGSEFINYEIVAYLDEHKINFTRGRAYRKNDQCFVEQKNGSIVRQIVGYDRYEGVLAQRQLAELYNALRLYVNFFQPSMKLVRKSRDGTKVYRKYDAAQTPLQRLFASSILTPDATKKLECLRLTLDPVRLLRQIQALQDAFWRHAIRGEATTVGNCVPVTFDSLAPIEAIDGGQAEISEGRGRKYRKSGKPRKPHTWRTRVDPFEKVNDELYGWFGTSPDFTAKCFLKRLQSKYPGHYPDNQLRTLQRKVRDWRSTAFLEFYAGDAAADSHPTLRAVGRDADVVREHQPR